MFGGVSAAKIILFGIGSTELRTHEFMFSFFLSINSHCGVLASWIA